MLSLVRMARPSTMSPKWKAFVDALGGRDAAMKLLGVGSTTLHRWSHEGVASYDKDDIKTIHRLANLYEVAVPIENTADMERLELLGAALRRGRRPEKAIDHSKRFYTPDRLKDIVRDDFISENVFKAACELYGGGLELLGALAKDRRQLPEKLLSRFRTLYSSDQLVKIADDDSASENVLRGVTLLLE